MAEEYSKNLPQKYLVKTSTTPVEACELENEATLEGGGGGGGGGEIILITGMQLREHKFYSAYNPDFRFTKDTYSQLQMYTTQASLGSGYIFAVFKRSFLHGKRIRAIIGTTGSYTVNNVHFYIKDGSYDRTSDTDFPTGSSIPDKGSGTLYSASFSTNAGMLTVDTDVLDLSSGQLETCTLMIMIIDGWSGQDFYVKIGAILIFSNETLVAMFYPHPLSVTMERTGTYGDYGYIGTLNEPYG